MTGRDMLRAMAVAMAGLALAGCEGDEGDTTVNNNYPPEVTETNVAPPDTWVIITNKDGRVYVDARDGTNGASSDRTKRIEIHNEGSNAETTVFAILPIDALETVRRQRREIEERGL